MTRTVLVLVLLGLIIAGYFYLPPTVPSATDNALNTETQSAQNANPSKTVSSKERSQALTHIKKITNHSEKTIDASTASHFVTEDQLIKLPDTADARLLVKKSGDISNNKTAQTFGVSIPVFNPKNNTLTDKEQPTSITDTTPIGTQIKLKELLDQSDSNGKKVFYIHAVNQKDEQGIWGIMQNGLTETFAKGITLSDNKTLIQATIPEEADETLTNKKSSFLGKLLHEKVATTHIYNFQQGLLGQNPDLITPGQQLIIVTFTEDELLNVYKHYSQQGQSE
ncbi:hypothetical protein [Neptunomonas japonica]|uniref:hypothetical protein n=1 Tax=Neptunomonas japonica TaxID=417574 RepID=UPI0003FEA83A|nr:hypothetical protein [Neptunomonas japonica]